MKYIVWITNGEGSSSWNRTDFITLKDAVVYATNNNYGSEFKITKEVEYTITEVNEQD